MARYRFYEDHKNQKVICVSSYEGKNVKATAKCYPTDEYSFENGAELAAIRVDVKIADKRVRRAKRKLAEALQKLEEAQNYVNRMQEYLDDSEEARDIAYQDLRIMEENL